MREFAVEQRLSPSEAMFTGGWTILGQKATEEQATAQAEVFYEARANHGYWWQVMRVRHIPTGEIVWDNIAQEAARMEAKKSTHREQE